jgi:hypothetical protein
MCVTQTNGRTDRHNEVNIPSPNSSLDLKKNNFLERFSKIHQTFLYTLFSTEGQTERRTDNMNRLSQFWHTVTNSPHIYRSPAKFLAFLQTVEPISHCCLSGQHSYTRDSLAYTIRFSSEVPISDTKLKSNQSEPQCGTVW